MGTWHVQAINAAGTSPDSSYRTFFIRPAVPTDLAVEIVSDHRADLTWTDNSGWESGTRVFRDGVAIGTVGAGLTSFSDTTFDPGISYTYYVRSYATDDLESVDSNWVTIYLPDIPSAPTLTAPANGATFEEGQAISLQWTDAGDDFYGEVWGGPSGTVPFGWQASTAYNLNSQPAGYIYSWHVRARNAAGTGDWSATRAFTIRPVAPGDLSVVPVSSSLVSLTWLDNSASEEGYYVYRGGTLVATLPAGSTSYDDTGANGNTTYTYTVRAYRGTVTSLSATASVLTLPAAPGINGPDDGYDASEALSVQLRWSVSGDEYSGELWGGPEGTITFGWQTGLSYEVSEKSVGATYSWHVRARNASGMSDWSPTRTFIVRPNNPTCWLLGPRAAIRSFLVGKTIQLVNKGSVSIAMGLRLRPCLPTSSPIQMTPSRVRHPTPMLGEPTMATSSPQSPLHPQPRLRHALCRLQRLLCSPRPTALHSTKAPRSPYPGPATATTTTARYGEMARGRLSHWGGRRQPPATSVTYLLATLTPGTSAPATPRAPAIGAPRARLRFARPRPPIWLLTQSPATVST
jgi:hypothetical protein